MLALGFSWCRACAAWAAAGDVRRGLCRFHRNDDERRRYAEDAGFRHYRKNRTSLRRRGVAAVPPEGIEALAERYGDACVYCGAAAASIDHMTPIARGGRTTPGNVVPACTSCNSRKKDMPFDEWLDKLAAAGVPLRDELVHAVEFAAASLYG